MPDAKLPWTPGPWHVEVQATAQAEAWMWGVHHDDDEREQSERDNVVAWEATHRPDAELIALAPEMAEAILAMDLDVPYHFTVDDLQRLVDVHDRLLQIRGRS